MIHRKNYARTLQKAFFAILFAAFFAGSLVFTPQLMADEGGIKSSTTLEMQTSTRPEAKLSLSQSFTFPFLQGSGPLTRGNNIKTGIAAEVSPVSLAGVAQAIWTPIAFLELSGGAKLGSGWNMSLGNGIGLNVPVEGSGSPRKAKIDGSAFDGLQWRAWGGGAFQFDIAALVPGDWNHVIFRVYDEMRYSAYTRAGAGDSWIIESDDGENRNGWISHGEAVLGYQMPLSPVLNFVGFMGELDFNLYNTPGGDYWGDKLGKWILSGLFNFSIHPRFDASLIVQMRTRRNHGISNFENRDYFYQDFELLSDGGKRRLVFYRAALILSYKIK